MGNYCQGSKARTKVSHGDQDPVVESTQLWKPSDSVTPVCPPAPLNQIDFCTSPSILFKSLRLTTITYSVVGNVLENVGSPDRAEMDDSSAAGKTTKWKKNLFTPDGETFLT